FQSGFPASAYSSILAQRSACAADDYSIGQAVLFQVPNIPAMTAKSPSSPEGAAALTHFDAQGQAHMVDVGAKASTHRIAVAEGRIRMQPETLELIASGSAKKGDVLGIARIAAIMAAKRTPELIPLCHAIML